MANTKLDDLLNRLADHVGKMERTIESTEALVSAILAARNSEREDQPGPRGHEDMWPDDGYGKGLQGAAESVVASADLRPEDDRASVVVVNRGAVKALKRRLDVKSADEIFNPDREGDDGDRRSDRSGDT